MSKSQELALKAERERHVMAGRNERVGQIDAELAALNRKEAKASKPSKTKRETASSSAPLERR